MANFVRETSLSIFSHHFRLVVNEHLESSSSEFVHPRNYILRNLVGVYQTPACFFRKKEEEEAIYEIRNWSCCWPSLWWWNLVMMMDAILVVVDGIGQGDSSGCTLETKWQGMVFSVTTPCEFSGPCKSRGTRKTSQWYNMWDIWPLESIRLEENIHITSSLGMQSSGSSLFSPLKI